MCRRAVSVVPAVIWCSCHPCLEESLFSLCPDGCIWDFRPGLSAGAAGETLCKRNIGTDVSLAWGPQPGLLVQGFCG